jgi:cytochrome c-type biogenesis protein CcmI
MIVFVVAALALFAVVLLLLCRPFMGKRTSLGVSHAHVNALAYQEHRRRLDMDLAEGSLSPHDHAQAQRELAQRVLDESHGDPSAAQASCPTPTRTLVAVGLWLPVTALCLYLWLGTPEAIEGPAAANSAAAQEVEQMVAGLVQKLKLDPNNPKGWAMLARSYKVMGRPLDAEKAYARAAQVMPLDAQMLADYADVAATNANGNFAGKPAALIQQALAAVHKLVFKLYADDGGAGVDSATKRAAGLIIREGCDAITEALAFGRTRAGQALGGHPHNRRPTIRSPQRPPTRPPRRPAPLFHLQQRSGRAVGGGGGRGRRRRLGPDSRL